jgi:LytS/YehU family sensor histidine kinase
LELDLLKKTIQPHFLMNALTAIRAWLIEKPKNAIKLLDALAGEIRPILDWTDKREIPLKQEVELCKSHLTVMGLRLEHSYEFITEGITGDEMVPPLIFHTLVENAFTHNDPHEFSTFTLKKCIVDSCVQYIFIVDSKHTEEENSDEGTGMRYVRKRLEEVFPGNWDLQYGSASEGYVVIIEILEE